MSVDIRDDLPDRFPGVRLDAVTIMPNHVHGVITLVGAGLAPARTGVGPKRVVFGTPRTTPSGWTTGRAGASPAPTLAGVIGAFKSLSDRRCREAFIEEYPDRRFGHLWQRDYHDHVVKDPAELDRIRQPSGAR